MYRIISYKNKWVVATEQQQKKLEESELFQLLHESKWDSYWWVPISL